eukprot:NODE_23470_length_665_cov_1.247212.p2 GENE.NODE_23470_length_665_cov_1.247212~~NODE_23470_length_665_cov_1.247212.p2  ORF type:complete len:70 (-),score=26.90 NODE_23470_length_665_cov_1.247212:105-314(-)
MRLLTEGALAREAMSATMEGPQLHCASTPALHLLPAAAETMRLSSHNTSCVLFDSVEKKKKKKKKKKTL